MLAIPAEVHGYYRRHRSVTQAILLLIFLGLPWFKIGDLPLVLVDVINYRVVLFGIIFQPHEAPLLFLVIASAVLTLAFATAFWGRIWCGWACPQTVFIDAVYRRIEHWVEGSYLERRRLETADLSFGKIRKKLTKWFLFLAVSSLFAHSFLAYFTGPDRLLEMMNTPPAENWAYFVFVSIFTFVTLINFAWFREQFCIYACPYGRLQSVLIDASTVTVKYNEERGEPRKSLHPTGEKKGDCVSCNRCVEVCPTGIDIRNGLQLECIACTACIDACDEIMVKVKKPTGLISYASLNGSAFVWKKPRAMAYLSALAVCLGVLAYSLGGRSAIDVSVARATGSPYELLKSETGEIVVNHFKIHLKNQSAGKGIYEVRLAPTDEARSVILTLVDNPAELPPNGEKTWHVFFRSPGDLFRQSGSIKIKIFIRNTLEEPGAPVVRELTLLGPSAQP